MPTSSKLAIRPREMIRPVVGGEILESIFKSVDLPAPFLPMIPIDSPAATSKEMFFSAQKSSTVLYLNISAFIILSRKLK